MGAPVTARWTRWLRRACFGVIAVLYVVAVPWYRNAGEQPAIVLGLPQWVAVALGCYATAAALNALAWWLTPIDDPPVEGADPR